MASSEGNIVGQLLKHTECSICMVTFTDPRVLPCLHTFCLKCLEDTASSINKKAGNKMPCPSCRKKFTVPSNGIAGLMRDFKMNSLIAVANDAIVSSSTTNINCDRHKTKQLEVFCLECEQPVCFSCLIDNHQGHKATDAVKAKEIFAKELADYMERISSYKEKSLHLMKEQDEKKKRYLKEIADKESAISRRSKELIDRIKRNTKSLLEELSSLKAQHMAEMEKEREELEKQCTIMENYQTEGKSSFLDICHVKRELPIIVETLNEWFKTYKVSSFEVLLPLQDKIEIDLKSEINNIVGRIEETAIDKSESSTLEEKKVIVVGFDDDGGRITNKVYEFNLHQPNEIYFLQSVPTQMQPESVTVSFDDKFFVIGIGKDGDEIWKFERISGWKKCANLEKGRRGHFANIVDTSIYICGGWDQFARTVLKSVEAHDLQTNKCSTVGELVHAVQMSASVAYKGLIYIFGGLLEGGIAATDCVQIFNTRGNTCSLFSKPMPSPQGSLRALSWNNSVILLNDETCFKFDFQTEIFRERDWFKTDVINFGLVHDEEKVYVFGGETIFGKRIFKCLFGENKTDPWTSRRKSRDEIKYVLLDDIFKGNIVEWKEHGRLPNPNKIYAYACSSSLSL